MKTKKCQYILKIALVITGAISNSNTFAQGFKSVINIAPLTIASNTGEKPQSKVWNYDNTWWSVLTDSEGTHIWKLKHIENADEYRWMKSFKISDSNMTYADCKLNSNVVHILLFDKSPPVVSSNLISVEYNPHSGKYGLRKSNPEPLCLNFGNNSVETATIDIDEQKKIWIAYEKDGRINVRWSDSPYAIWSDETSLTDGVKDDDICSIVRLQNKIGVLWSNQNSKRFGFKIHLDSSTPSVWSDDEVPGYKYALEIGGGMSDDHINMAVARDGTLYCAVKTSYDKVGYTKIGLLIRDPDGNWSELHKVSENGTRPIVILNELTQNLKVLYTEIESGGNIIYKKSDSNKILFGAAQTLIDKGDTFRYNNVSSAKNNYTSEIVIIASSGNKMASVLAKE